MCSSCVSGWSERTRLSRSHPKPCRKRQIDEDLSLLQRDVQKVLTQNGGSLGNKNADAVWAKFQEGCPELAQ